MTEQELVEKLSKIERLFAGATTEGERSAAQNAGDRIRKRLKQVKVTDPPVEYKFTFVDMWSRKLFVALARRYGLVPFRYKRQRYTTVMMKAPKSFIDETLWPEFSQLNEVLNEYLANATDNIIHSNIHADTSEASVVEEPRGLSL
ncbi:MAG: hypothetical protein ACI9SQ_002231 [Rubritalea sp.]|jgi:hypothetical protein